MILQKVVVTVPNHDSLDFIKDAFYKQGYTITDSDASIMWEKLSPHDQQSVRFLGNYPKAVVDFFLKSGGVTIPSYHVEGVEIVRPAPVNKHIVCSVCNEELPYRHPYLKAVSPENALQSPLIVCAGCLGQGGKVSISVDILSGAEDLPPSLPLSPLELVESPPSELFVTHLVNYVKAVLPSFKVAMRGDNALVGGYYELRFPAFPLEQGVELWGGGIRVRSRRIRDVKSALFYIEENLSPELLVKDTKKLVNAVMESRIPKSNLRWIAQMSGLTRSRIGLLLSLPSGGEDDILSLIEVGRKSCPDKVDRNVPASMDSVYIAVGGLYSPDADLHQITHLKWKESR